MMNTKLKRHFLLLLLVIIFSMELNAQQKFSVGLTFSPNYAHRFISPKSYSSARHLNDHPIYTSTTGVQFRYMINNKMYLRSGILYSELGNKTIIIKEEHPDIIFFEDFNTLIAKFKYVYLDIPFEFQYQFRLNNNTNFFISSGLSVNIFQRAFYIKTVDGEKIDKRDETNYSGYTSEIKKVNYSMNLGIGLIHSKSKFNFTLQPIFRQNISSKLNPNPNNIKVYQHTLGLEFGVFYTLGKGEKQKEKQ
jgi:hypothetical protein